MFLGEYEHSIDEKGRLIIPSKFRENLGAMFIITRGLDKCLFVYPKTEWESLEKKLTTLSFTKSDFRKFTRFFFSGACEGQLDKQGRVNLPLNLRKYASLHKECVIIGVSTRLEIWCKEIWENYYASSEESFNEIAENIVDMDF